MPQFSFRKVGFIFDGPSAQEINLIITFLDTSNFGAPPERSRPTGSNISLGSASFNESKKAVQIKNLQIVLGKK